MEAKRMPQETLSFIQRVQEYGLFGYAWLMVVSIWAGTARYLTTLNGEKPTFFGWMRENVISGFVGIITIMTCQYYGVDYLLTGAIVGVTSHNGTRSLYMVGEILRKNGNPISRIIDEPDRKKVYSKKDE